MRTLALALIGIWSLAGACASKNASAPTSQSADALGGPKVESADRPGTVAVVNAWCPIATENAVGFSKMTAKEHTRTWRGQRVGFCCDSCPHVWDEMNDEQKSAALAAATKRELQIASPKK